MNEKLMFFGFTYEQRGRQYSDLKAVCIYVWECLVLATFVRIYNVVQRTYIYIIQINAHIYLSVSRYCDLRVFLYINYTIVQLLQFWTSTESGTTL